MHRSTRNWGQHIDHRSSYPPQIWPHEVAFPPRKSPPTSLCSSMAICTWRLGVIRSKDSFLGINFRHFHISRTPLIKITCPSKVRKQSFQQFEIFFDWRSDIPITLEKSHKTQKRWPPPWTFFFHNFCPDESLTSRLKIDDTFSDSERSIQIGPDWCPDELI